MRPGVLMWDKAGQRVAVQSADLDKSGGSGAAEVSVDDVLAMVELPEERTAARQQTSSARMWGLLAVVVVALVVAAVVLGR